MKSGPGEIPEPTSHLLTLGAGDRHTRVDAVGQASAAVAGVERRVQLGRVVHGTRLHPGKLPEKTLCVGIRSASARNHPFDEHAGATGCLVLQRSRGRDSPDHGVLEVMRDLVSRQEERAGIADTVHPFRDGHGRHVHDGVTVAVESGDARLVARRLVLLDIHPAGAGIAERYRPAVRVRLGGAYGLGQLGRPYGRFCAGSSTEPDACEQCRQQEHECLREVFHDSLS